MPVTKPSLIPQLVNKSGNARKLPLPSTYCNSVPFQLNSIVPELVIGTPPILIELPFIEASTLVTVPTNSSVLFILTPLLPLSTKVILVPAESSTISIVPSDPVRIKSTSFPFCVLL